MSTYIEEESILRARLVAKLVREVGLNEMVSYNIVRDVVSTLQRDSQDEHQREVFSEIYSLVMRIVESRFPPSSKEDA